MQRSKSVVGRRAWNILRLALLWARKGGVFLDHLSHIHFLNHFHHSHNGNGNGNGALQYGHRQLSFDATPMIHIRMHRPNSMRFRLPHIPCINPHSNHHMFDFDDHDYQSEYQPTNSFLIGNGQQQQQQQDDDDDEEEEEDQLEEDGIDLKAEQFIANFYEQLKLQRQFNPTTTTRTSSD